MRPGGLPAVTLLAGLALAGGGCWLVEGTLDTEQAQALSRRFVEVERGGIEVLERAGTLLNDLRQSCAERRRRVDALMEEETPKLRERLRTVREDLERANPPTRRRALELAEAELKFIVARGFAGTIVGATEAFRRNCPAEARKVVPKVLEYRRSIEHAAALTKQPE